MARMFVVRQLDIGIVALLVGLPDSVYEDFKFKILNIYDWKGLKPGKERRQRA